MEREGKECRREGEDQERRRRANATLHQWLLQAAARMEPLSLPFHHESSTSSLFLSLRPATGTGRPMKMKPGQMNLKKELKEKGEKRERDESDGRATGSGRRR